MSTSRSNGAVDLAARRDRAAGIVPVSPALLARARQARRLRATMSAFLPRDLLVDPAWDMMIDLFIAVATGERLHVSRRRRCWSAIPTRPITAASISGSRRRGRRRWPRCWITCSTPTPKTPRCARSNHNPTSPPWENCRRNDSVQRGGASNVGRPRCTNRSAGAANRLIPDFARVCAGGAEGKPRQTH
jgi:hypothetical protein